MPALDGTQILAIASFAALVIAWLMAPTESAVVVAEREPLPAPVAA
ncbi:MAG: hypothetical protein HYU87_05920 [Chloroflexi bacterium]|nr:hypothetical protein [Chloroflexota bacterium]